MIAGPKAPEPAVRAYRDGDWRPSVYVVKKGDTLYSIALDHGEDYKDVARWNGIADPAVIRIGQELRLVGPDGPVQTVAKDESIKQPQDVTTSAIPLKSGPKPVRMAYSDAAVEKYFPATLRAEAPQKPEPVAKLPVATPELRPPVRTEPPQTSDQVAWGWPTQGKVAYEFGAGTNKKGLGIEGKSGQPVMAAAGGKVVYSGSGLRGYGKLIIVKHNDMYLSVYAHNSQLLVREGQMVNKGQRIAEMGSSDSDRTALHFEIRKFGKPVDPMTFLPLAGKS
jgi:lipoprotein NlpD